MAKELDTANLKRSPRTTVERPEEKPVKKKAGRRPTDPDGRKKKEYTKNVNVAIHLDTFAKMEIAKAKYGNNITKYINTLVEKDLEANYETYKNIYDILND